jgi:hypothetical protein
VRQNPSFDFSSCVNVFTTSIHNFNLLKLDSDSHPSIFNPPKYILIYIKISTFFSLNTLFDNSQQNNLLAKNIIMVRTNAPINKSN